MTRVSKLQSGIVCKSRQRELEEANYIFIKEQIAMKKIKIVLKRDTHIKVRERERERGREEGEREIRFKKLKREMPTKNKA